MKTLSYYAKKSVFHDAFGTFYFKKISFVAILVGVIKYSHNVYANCE